MEMEMEGRGNGHARPTRKVGGAVTIANFAKVGTLSTARRCSYGVFCDYETHSSELHFSGTASFQLEVQKPQQTESPPAFNAEELIDSMMDAPLALFVEGDTPDVCYLDKAHLSLLRKFHDRSVLTIGTPNSIHVYQRVLTQMASKHSFVLHAVLRFTLLHDRYLYDPLGTSPSAAEAFHGYHAAALFSQVLSESSHSNDVKDALWGTSALLGAGSFAAFEGISAAEAWPLKPPSVSDLDWLKMSEGKNAVWRLANPTRDDSQFRDVIEAELRKQNSIPLQCVGPAVDGFRAHCAHLMEAGEDSPYFQAASILERLAPMQCSHETAIWFLSFVGHMDPAYMQLVAAKDSTALVLLAWWFAKLLEYNVWWVSRRCRFECQAICVFLNEKLPQEDVIRDLLEFPRSVSHGASRKPVANVG
ncbi:uncharacterized protein RCC_04119 [Ramularia collo-cygni]|uniref:Uncharacterized protein n=1 Tax=Ramularia collo-cygni TaxID=112498 RepID=A0A2D3V6V4_9PEZI|nr:uncharacterized protein RCC_04119 [Ramularia collo-cygni]CZT18274.1 uncharacterized protein RCC_04119 [Ramularia collo-cygni]